MRKQHVQLARQFYAEVQVILGGKVKQPAQQLARENRSLIYFVTNESRALGILRLRLMPAMPPRKLSPMKSACCTIKFPRTILCARSTQNYRDEIRHTNWPWDDPNNLGEDMVLVRGRCDLCGHPPSALAAAKS